MSGLVGSLSSEAKGIESEDNVISAIKMANYYNKIVEESELNKNKKAKENKSKETVNTESLVQDIKDDMQR